MASECHISVWIYDLRKNIPVNLRCTHSTSALTSSNGSTCDILQTSTGYCSCSRTVHTVTKRSFIVKRNKCVVCFPCANPMKVPTTTQVHFCFAIWVVECENHACYTIAYAAVRCMSQRWRSHTRRLWKSCRWFSWRYHSPSNNLNRVFLIQYLSSARSVSVFCAFSCCLKQNPSLDAFSLICKLGHFRVNLRRQFLEEL